MQVADPLTLYRQPANLFVAGFMGSPPMNLLPGRVQRCDGTLFFVGEDEGALRVPLRGRLGRLAEGHRDKRIILGVRPEHLKANGGGESHWPATFVVEFAEPMGAESIVYLQTGSRGLIARIAGEHFYKAGDKLTIHLNLDKVHLFDPESENVISEHGETSKQLHDASPRP
jgi:multiple sugar transport system ATP-binding protein